MSGNQSNIVEKHLYFTLSYNESLVHHFELLIYHFQQLVLQSSVVNAVRSWGIEEENHRLQTGFFGNKTISYHIFFPKKLPRYILTKCGDMPYPFIK